MAFSSASTTFSLSADARASTPVSVVTGYRDAEPTPEQRRAADDLVERCFAAAQHNWYRYENGLRDGFRLQDADENHYYNWEYITDGAFSIRSGQSI